MDLTISDDVRAALEAGRPVVALESTIITHGMPYPENVECHRSVERAVRANGAVPAPVAVLGGRIHVGLSSDALDVLARTGRKARKCSRRDLAVCVARGEAGATTVAATMIVAQRAGIKVFVTGGIGGVHRGAEETMDVSADLIELGRTDVAVVCAGVKSILDIGKTLEVLETQGVTVCAYGADEFPAFFTRSSGHKAHVRVDSADEAAGIIRANAALRLESGVLIAVPVPAEDEANAARMAAATDAALAEAAAQGIAGKDVTPFLLQRVSELSGGESLRANVALVRNNARVGAEIACALCAGE